MPWQRVAGVPADGVLMVPAGLIGGAAISGNPAPAPPPAPHF